MRKQFFHVTNMADTNKRDLGFMSRIAVTSKFKMRWFPNEGRYWAGKLLTYINLVPHMPDENKTFSGLSFGFENLMTSRAHTLHVNAHCCWLCLIIHKLYWIVKYAIKTLSSNFILSLNHSSYCRFTLYIFGTIFCFKSTIKALRDTHHAETWQPKLSVSVLKTTQLVQPSYHDPRDGFTILN